MIVTAVSGLFLPDRLLILRLPDFVPQLALGFFRVSRHVPVGGPDTEKLASSMKTFDPDESWIEAPTTPPTES